MDCIIIVNGIKPDSSFRWTYRADNRENRKGYWCIKSDTLILKFSPDTLIRRMYNKTKGNFIDTTVYKASTSKWIITDEMKLNTCYRPKNDTTGSNVVYSPSYYYKLLEYNDNGKVVKEYKYGDSRNQVILESSSYGNGIKKHIIEFKNGLKHGIEIEFYENGSINFIGSWKKGRRRGRWKFFDDNGRIKKIIKGKKIKTGTNLVDD